jgi:hypothetical protein
MSQPRLRMRRRDGRTIKVGTNTFRRSDTATSQYPYYFQGYSYGGVNLVPGFYPIDFSLWEVDSIVSEDIYCDTDIDVANEFGTDVVNTDASDPQGPSDQQTDDPQGGYEAPQVYDYGQESAPASQSETHSAPPQQDYSPPPEQSYTPPAQDYSPPAQDYSSPPSQDYGSSNYGDS